MTLTLYEDINQTHKYIHAGINIILNKEKQLLLMYHRCPINALLIITCHVSTVATKQVSDKK